jgi:hypothetical protein
MYEQTGFPDDELSLGYMIHVYQDSINKVFPEYLVNFDYFVRMMGNYGFVLVEATESQKMGLPHGSGLFSELFAEMESEVERNPRMRSDYGKALSMTSDEKWVSFMNRYFVFRKVHHVDAEKIYKQFVSKQMVEDVAKDLAEAVETAKITETAKPKAKKLGKKIILTDYSPVDDVVKPATDLPKKATDLPKVTYGNTVTIKKAVKK